MFNLLLTQPLTNLVIFLYNAVAFCDLGIAVILFALLIKIILFPLSKKTIESQAKMQEIQPKLKEIQEKYKDNKEEQTKQMMELWKKEKVNPLGGCLPMLIQFPIIIAIFEMFRHGIPQINGVLYSFVLNPGVLNPKFLGFLELASGKIIPLAILAGILQYFQIKLTMPSNKDNQTGGFGAVMSKQFILLFPLLGGYMVYIFPAVLGIYWIAFTAFSILEHMIIKKIQKKQKVVSIKY